ncbi:MAG TPA: D-alanine--D-alanine ligase [Steroidobacteraceae bacterium]|nr:D-alanine--D-alanine ligase [Steroidobacteraceae bacterium]
MRIAVLFGGTSAERDVSVASAAQIIPALGAAGHDVVAVDTARGRLPAAEIRRLLETGVTAQPPTQNAIADVRNRAVALSAANFDIRDVDVVFIALHGGAGEDGRIQAMLDLAGLPYTGSHHIGSAAAMDKDLSKRLFRSVQVPTPDWLMAPVCVDQVARELGWPVIVKPNKQGSTVGLTLVRSAAGLDPAMEAAYGFDDEVMVERFVVGREFTVGILDGVALPVGEIIAPGDVFDYEAKYQPEVAREVFPADISAEETRRIQGYALRAHQALKLGAYSRMDFRRDRDGEYWCLEANTLPGLTATSLLPQAARAAGIEFPELLERICRAAVRAARRQAGHAGEVAPTEPKS